MIKGLLNEFISHGEKGAVVPVSRFDDLKSEMEDLKKEEYHIWSDWMAETMVIPKAPDFEPRSIISVITFSPKVLLEFSYRGKPVHCIVPPQYSDEGSKDMEVLQYINTYLSPLGFKAVFTYNLPQKLLAVHCGLAIYGRNNVCFNEEFGSYMRLLTYFSDLPCDDAPWFPIRCMEKCEKCSACITACPTNAIESTQRIVNTSRCLTFMNEFAGEFPDWVNKDAHNSIIGCMNCQDCCPKNAYNKNNIIKGVVFTEEETSKLLKHKIDQPYTGSLENKIKETGLSAEMSKMLSRNLEVLLQNIS